MSPVSNMAMAFAVKDEDAAEVCDVLCTRHTCAELELLLQQHYMCCDRILLEETDGPEETAEFFVKVSRSQGWHRRQMRPLQHLDIIAYGGALYLLYDRYLLEKHKIRHATRLPGMPNLVLVKLKPEDDKRMAEKQAKM